MSITTEQVWQELEKQVFAVLGMVTAKGEARTAGVVYEVHGRHHHPATRRIYHLRRGVSLMDMRQPEKARGRIAV